MGEPDDVRGRRLCDCQARCQPTASEHLWCAWQPVAVRGGKERSGPGGLQIVVLCRKQPPPALFFTSRSEAHAAICEVIGHEAFGPWGAEVKRQRDPVLPHRRPTVRPGPLETGSSERADHHPSVFSICPIYAYTILPRPPLPRTHSFVFPHSNHSLRFLVSLRWSVYDIGFFGVAAGSTTNTPFNLLTSRQTFATLNLDTRNAAHPHHVTAGDAATHVYQDCRGLAAAGSF